jgi:hypothetical protein
MTTTTSTPNPAKAGEIAQQIVAILSDHDSDTRCRAISAAMTLLGEGSPPSTHQRDSHALDVSNDGRIGLAEFFDRGEKLKPADYAQLCAAYHYANYGVIPFSLEDIRAIARDVGVVLPDRLDKTFRAAAYSGKKLFQLVGRSTFKPTAAAGMAFNERWKVRPGKNVKALGKSRLSE